MNNPKAPENTTWNKARAWLLCCWISMWLVLLLNFFTHFISDLEKLYSGSPAFRWQTDAFFKGHMMLDPSPYNMHQDLVWDHGVQQVWGLGVPAFRFLFELPAKALGQAFPDKITFLIACLLSFTLLIRTFFAHKDDGSAAAGWKFLRTPCALAVLLFAPPFLTLLSSTFQVYEEAVAYEYLYGLVLFALLLRAASKPSTLAMLTLAIWAGLGAFVRPTLLFYGAISLALAIGIAWRKRMGLRTLVTMTALFCLGTGLLCYTNWVRFGAAGEFGHELNICGNVFFTFVLKVGCPFESERLIPAVTDNLGSLFFMNQLNGEDYYQKNFFWGQSQALRIHQMYFQTFDLLYLLIFIAAALAWISNWRQIRTRWKTLTDTTPQSDAQRFSTALTLLGIPWAAASFLCLFAFYLHCPSITSRYALDFLPAVSVAIATLIWQLFDLPGINTPKLCKAAPAALCIATVAWLGIEAKTSKTTHSWNDSLDQQGIGETCPMPAVTNEVESHRSYETGNPGPSQLFCNGMGWDTKSGEVSSMVELYASDPECVKLKLCRPDGKMPTTNDIAPIQVKIGLERLTRESAQATSNNITLVYKGPQTPRYQKGLQICFISFILPKDLGVANPSVSMSGVSFIRKDP